MAKDIEGNSTASSDDAILTSTIEAKPDQPTSRLLNGDIVTLGPNIEVFKTGDASIEFIKAELPNVEAPKLADVRPDAEPEAPPAAEPTVAAPALKRSSRFALLAASVAGAAAIGALGGALGGAALVRSTDTTAIPAGDEIRSLQGALVQLQADLAVLRTSIEAGTKNANGQFAKIAERFDRVERAQADPAARIAKATEALERLVGKEPTGSMSASRSASAAMPGQPSQAVIEGWVVRDVNRGVAVVQGRRFGMIEVQAGDTIPGVGRVDAIRKQDGRWVVVTSRGIVTSAP